MESKKDVIPGPGYYLVKPIDRPDEQTAHGIVMPASYRDSEPNMGEVIKVGPGSHFSRGRLATCASSGAETLPMYAKEGDTILFMSHNPIPVMIDGHEFALIDNRDILGWVI